jgi:hypothetical protein
MSAASDYLEDKLLNHTLRNTAFTQPSGLFIALFSGAPSTILPLLEANSGFAEYEIQTYGTDSTASNYTRVAVTFAAASGGSASTSGNVTFPTAGSNYTNSAESGSTVTCIAVMDASTSGNVLFKGQLDNAKEILDGDTFQISTGNLTISLA